MIFCFVFLYLQSKVSLDECRRKSVDNPFSVSHQRVKINCLRVENRFSAHGALPEKRHEIILVE